jgi:transcriptional regulator with XRE-family HTH domain
VVFAVVVVFAIVVFALVARLLEMALQLFLRLPTALPHRPHLLGGGGNMCMLVGTNVPHASTAGIAHTGIVPPKPPPRKTRGTLVPPALPPLIVVALLVHYAALMDKSTSALAAVIGARVRQERQSRGWTLDQLAETTGVSRRMVVNVEQGAANPSVGTLLRISDALGIGLPELVDAPRPKPVTVIRSGDGAALWTSSSGGRGVLVAGTGSPDVVELWDWTLASGDRHASEAHASGTKELLQVREGSVTVVVAGEIFVLHAGDAVSFPGDVEHSYSNPGSDPARFSLAVFEPGVGSGHHTEAPDA